MKSICDGVCKEYGRIYRVVETEQKFADATKHLCVDCFHLHKKSEDVARVQRREVRANQQKHTWRPKWKAS